MLKILPFVYYAFGAILMGGGAMGSKVSGKSSSLMGSAAFAVLAIVAGILLKNNPRIGLILGLVNSLAVAGFFFYRYTSTGKPFPAFPSIGLSLIVLALTVIAMAKK